MDTKHAFRIRDRSRVADPRLSSDADKLPHLERAVVTRETSDGSRSTRTSQPSGSSIAAAHRTFAMAQLRLCNVRRFSSLVPLAQPHPRKPSGLSQSIDSTPFAQPHPRNLDSPQRTRLPHPPRRIALCRISRPRPLFGLIPFAQLHPRKKTSGRGFIPSVNSRQTSSPPLAPIHPRKLSRLRQSLGLTPLAQLHPRNLDSPQRTRFSRTAPPRAIAVSRTPRPSSSLLRLRSLTRASFQG